MLPRFIAVAACAVALTAGTAASSATYTLTSHIEGDDLEHSLWFAGSNPPGATGTDANHFLFENGDGGYGTLDVNEMTGEAVLSGQVKNADGQGFDLLMNLMVDTTTAYDAKGPKGSPDITQWTFFSLVSGMLTSLDASLADYDITGLMSATGKTYGVQLGFGANDKDAAFGLSSWIYMQESGCSTCATLNGDINVSVSEVPLPAGMVLLPGALMLLGAAGRIRRTRR